MKIADLEVSIIPGERYSVRDALQELTGSDNVRVVVHSDTGASGVGEIWFGRGRGAPEALAALIENALKPVLIGADLSSPTLIRQALLKETEYYGPFGLAMFGIAAVDTAVWDCVGKAQGVPCWQLWGKVRERIPAYAMVGWLDFSLEDLARVCARAVEQGFGMVKIKVGSPTLAEDLERLAAARRAVGDKVGLAVDANQVLDTAEAIRRGREFEKLGCVWWEEPLPKDDIDGYAELAEALEIPVATGENLYTKEDFDRFLARGAVGVVQADLRRAGGPTGLLEVGKAAAKFGRPYASHGGGPVQLNVMACLKNAYYLETGLLKDDSPIKLVEGCFEVPKGAGFS